MADIVIFVPGAIWESWRAGALGAPWTWGQTAKPPPIGAGERVWVASMGRVRGHGALIAIETHAAPDDRRRAWLMRVEPLVEADGPAVASLSTWRYADRVGIEARTLEATYV